MNTKHSMALAVAGILLATTAAAQETSLSVSAGVTHSDNISRVSQDEQSETMPEAGLQLNLTREGRLEAVLSADLTYRSYQENSIDSNGELVGGMDARLAYAFIPDRFSWTVENNYGQSLIDPQAVETPDNRQDMNYFSTGPDIEFLLSGKTSLVMSGRWSDLTYEESDFGNQRLSGSVGLLRRIDGASSLQLDVTAQRVEFDGSPVNGYDQQSASLAYEAEGTRTQIELRGGLTEVHDSGDTFDHPLLNVSLTRKLTDRSTVALVAGTGIVDSADAFRRDRGIAGVSGGSENVVASPDVVEEDYLAASWSLTGGRTTLELSANWRDEERKFDVNFDRTSLDISLHLARRIGPRLTARVYGMYRDTDYDTSDIQYDEWLAGLGFNWSLSRNYGLVLQAEHWVGGGDTSAGSGTRDYEENRYTLRFTYSSGR